jgi:hypothetical protein
MSAIRPAPLARMLLGSYVVTAAAIGFVVLVLVGAI